MNENAVCLTGHSGHDHGTIEVVDPKTKAKTTRCKKFSTITCDDHEKAQGEAVQAGKFQFQYVPQSYVVAPDGSTLFDLAGAFAKKTGIEKLKEAAKKVGAGMTAAAWDRAKAAMADGEGALAKGDLKSALQSFRAAGREKGATKAIEEKVVAKVGEVEAKGLEAVEAAKAQGDPAVARKRLQEIARDLSGTKAAEAAQKAIAALG